MKTTVSAKTIKSGAMTALSESRIFLDRAEEAVINSFEARKRIKKIAMSAPPTPIDTAVVIEMALALDEVVVTIVDSILPSQNVFIHHIKKISVLLSNAKRSSSK